MKWDHFWEMASFGHYSQSIKLGNMALKNLKILLKIILIGVIIANANGNLSGGDRFDCRSQQILEGSLPTGSKKWSMDTLKPILASKAIPWPETAFNIPQVKFAAKKVQSSSSAQDQKLVLLLGLQTSIDPDKSTNNTSFIYGKSTNVSSAIIDTLDVGSIFNCFIDRSSQNPCNSGQTNPRCCYDNDYSSIHQEMSAVYPACKTSSCPDLQRLAKEEETPYTFSCRAVCSYDAILLVEFSDNDMQSSGGETSLSMSNHRIALIQKNGEFIEIDSDLGESHFKSHSGGQFGSTLNNETVTGFWVSWVDPDKETKRGPILKIGQDGQEKPFFVHSFDQFCFDCEAQDQYGWNGLDVQFPRASKVFKPTVYSLNAVQGNKYQIFTNCSNVIYSQHQVIA